MVLLFLAEGFEEIEVITTADIVRRAGLELELVSVTGTRLIKGAHGITVMADTIFRKCRLPECRMMVLPGGMPGTKNLAYHDGLKKALTQHYTAQRHIAAICAAPSILGSIGLLEGVDATCYPGFEHLLTGANFVSATPVVHDRKIITANGPAVAPEFALEIVKSLLGAEKMLEVKRGMNFKM